MAKLPKGLYQRGSIFWTKVYQHGRPIYQSTGTSNLTEAKRILDVRRGAAQRGESVLPQVDRVRWEEAQVDLIAYYEATGKRDVTEAKSRVAHLGLYFAGWRIARIDTPAGHGYVVHRKQQKAAAATINRELATLWKGLRVAHQNKKLAGQPPRIEKLQEDNIRQGFFERDPGVERPWDRTGFRHPDLRPWVLAHRAELVTAALTMVRGWLVAGKPPVEHPPIGSFESWAAAMAGVLRTAGIKGFLTNYKDVYEAASSEVGEWVDLEAWFEVHGPEPVLVKDLCALAHQKELLPDVLGDGMDTSQRTRLGNALASRRGRIFAGYQIHFDGRSKHGTQYRLKVVAAPVAVAEPAVTLEAEEAPF